MMAGKPGIEVPVGVEDPLSGPRLRCLAYLACLAASLAIHVFFVGSSDGLAVMGTGLVVLSAVSWLLIAGLRSSMPHPALPGIAIAAALYALLVPLGGEIAARNVPEAVADNSVWPQILVCLFSARTLSEAAELRFIRYWREPAGLRGRVAVQSLASAALMGCALTLLFYRLLSGMEVPAADLAPTTVVARALLGETAIHVGLVVLFFTTLAAIADAALISMQDAGLLRIAANSGRPEYSYLRAHHWLSEPLEAPTDRSDLSTLEAFHRSSRSFIRTLISFLPLLGFLGTVIGLTVAIGGLPSELDLEASGRLDISASLNGLAVQFETTLLGLSGALISSMLLALLEKREAEIAAQCRRLAQRGGDVR